MKTDAPAQSLLDESDGGTAYTDDTRPSARACWRWRRYEKFRPRRAWELMNEVVKAANSALLPGEDGERPCSQE